MSEDITKYSTVRNFFKSVTEQRISSDAIPVIIENLNELTREIALKAEELCLADDRSTIMERDVKKAFNTVGGGIQNTPEGLFKAIEKMEPEDIGNISLLIAEWVKEHRKKLSVGG